MREGLPLGGRPFHCWDETERRRLRSEMQMRLRHPAVRRNSFWCFLARRHRSCLRSSKIQCQRRHNPRKARSSSYSRLTCTLHGIFSEHPTLPLWPALADLMQIKEHFAQPSRATCALSQVWPAAFFEITRVISHDHTVDIRELSLLYRLQDGHQATSVLRCAVACLARRS